MRSVIQQSVSLPASAAALYAMYLDPAKHEEVTGAPVTITADVGGEFSAFDGALSGSILSLVENRLIVQSWRSSHFHETDPDSTLILQFTDDGESGRIDLVHLDVPEHDYDPVVEGWEKYYWVPWREYLRVR